MRSNRPVTCCLLALGLSAVVLPGSAQAARPEVQKHSCEDSGGTFARTAAVKTCTTVSTAEVPGPVVTRTGEDGPYGGCVAIWPPGTSACTVGGYFVTATSQVMTLVETTLIRRQRGNAALTETRTDRVQGTRLVAVSCSAALYRRDILVPPGHTTATGQVFNESVGDAGPVDVSRCQALGLL